MVLTKADRPYGSFPRAGAPAEPAAPAAPPRRRRWWQPAPGRRARRIRRGAFLASVLLLVLALMAPAPPLAIVAVPQAPATLSATDLYAQVGPSVVEIHTAGANPRIGSGVLVDSSGLVLTSLHVVKDGSITVRFADGTEARGAIVNQIPEQDVAVVQTSTVPFGIPAATMGDPNHLRVGDPAYVIGSPFGLTSTLSVGSVSGLGRTVRLPVADTPLGGLIQFDGAVNPGNSGGPLVDSRGEVVGIVVGVPKGEDGMPAVGIGFAVTIDSAGGALGLPPE